MRFVSFSSFHILVQLERLFGCPLLGSIAKPLWGNYLKTTFSRPRLGQNIRTNKKWASKRTWKNLKSQAWTWILWSFQVHRSLKIMKFGYHEVGKSTNTCPRISCSRTSSLTIMTYTEWEMESICKKVDSSHSDMKNLWY